MARALVSAINDQLSPFITSEFTSIANVEGEVQKLKRKFHIIQALLNDAEKRQVKEEAMKLWIDELKDVSYQVDDVLDEWNTAIIKEKIEKQQDEKEKAETSAGKKRKVTISIPNLFQHRDIAHKIKELKEKLDEIDREGEVYKFVLTRGNEEVERPRTTSFVDVSEILGRDKVRDDLVSILLGKGSEEVRNPHVISLVGMGGIGKTTLAQLAYNDNEVKAHFEIKVWVCVSDPFDQCKVAKEILESIEHQSPNLTALQSLSDRICNKVSGKKFLLVFDDVWTEDSTMWEPFRIALKCAAQGSRIIVTTRKIRVAEIMGSASMINLEVLSKEDCWLVFRKIAFFNRDPRQCEQLEGLSRQIVEKCKGLPLAAKTLGSLMRFKRSIEEWRRVLDSNLWELEVGEIESLYAPLLLSYYDLSLPLRRCFSFCAIFPKDYVFSRDELVFMWMAQGYINLKTNMEMEIIAREYFENLAIRSFFQDFEKDGDGDQIIRCKMHDIVHDFAQSISKNECFTINSDKDLGVDYKNARHLHLKLMDNAKVPESIFSAKNLRTLIFASQGGYDLSISSQHFISQHFRYLRVLTLFCGYYSMLTEVPGVVENFIHLRYLYLVNYSRDTLPKTICNLCNLQILHIEYIGFSLKLPQGMNRLINLRHFKLNWNTLTFTCPNINFPRGFGRLTSLRTLNNFCVNGEDDSERCKLGELRNLDHLQGTLLIAGLGNEVNQREATNAQLKKKKNLRTLKLFFHPDKWDPKEITRGMDALVLNALEPPPNLEDLSIFYYKGLTMSPWMVSLTNLKKLDFWNLFIEHLPPLGKLPVLESLRIGGINRLKKLGVEFMGIEESEKKEKDDISITLFPNLISLKFSSLIEWEEWNGIGEEEEKEDCTKRFAIMPRLQELKIWMCPKLKSLPNFLFTTPLQRLEIQNCQILEERYERGIGEEWPKISHIPSINLTPSVKVTFSDASSSSWSSSFILQYINIKLIKM